MSILLLILIVVAIGWPYHAVYRLDQAIVLDDRDELHKWIDLEAVRRNFRQLLDTDIEEITDQFDNPVFRFLRGGVKELTTGSFEAIDVAWIREAILLAERNEQAGRRPVIGGFSFACFERPTRFLVRAGALGKNPVHLYLTLQNWQWRVTAVFV